jgi:hypothetical protein
LPTRPAVVERRKNGRDVAIQTGRERRPDISIEAGDHRGRRVRKVVSGDKAVAQKILADALATVEKRRAGLLQVDPREAKRDLQEHIDAYLGELQRRGRDAMYRYTVGKHLEGAAFAQDWRCLNDCTSSSIAAYLKDLASEGRSGKTVNQHRADLSAFFGWCRAQGYPEFNPCEQVQKTTVKSDPKRRALSVMECRRLIKVAPPERSWVYLVLVYAGLRRAEAGSIRWGHVTWTASTRTSSCPPASPRAGGPRASPWSRRSRMRCASAGGTLTTGSSSSSRSPPWSSSGRT